MHFCSYMLHYRRFDLTDARIAEEHNALRPRDLITRVLIEKYLIRSGVAALKVYDCQRSSGDY